jgi:ABC-type amino acid transport substrate-binding protein
VRRLPACGFLLILAAPALAAQAASTPAPQKELVVGVYQAPPWSIRDPDGSWRGATVDLWKAVAAEAGLAYRLQEIPPAQILDGVADGRYATSAGPWAATVERQQIMDFSHGYVLTGLGIAVRSTSERDRWLSFVETLTTPTALKLYSLIALLALVAGTVVWRLERRHNPQFPARPLPGIGSGFWWAGVTTSGVGYGDKVPATVWGRAVALLWMLISVVLITALIGFVTARLAVAELGDVRGLPGLRRVTVGTIESSSAADFLRREQIAHRMYANIPDAFAALRAREVRAVVFSDAVLRYYAQRDTSRSIEIVPGLLEPQTYAFPLADGSSLREPINRALRHVLASSIWRDIDDRYLGADGGR